MRGVAQRNAAAKANRRERMDIQMLELIARPIPARSALRFMGN
jgi:hypothetical protein